MVVSAVIATLGRDSPIEMLELFPSSRSAN
jgi:hypothetical protein